MGKSDDNFSDCIAVFDCMCLLCAGFNSFCFDENHFVSIKNGISRLFSTSNRDLPVKFK